MIVNRSILILIVWISILAVQPEVGLGLSWPIGDGDTQKQVTSTFGEFRPISGDSAPYNVRHFHDGIDIYGPAGTAVYGVEVYVDTIWSISEGGKHVRTQYHDYFHINPENNLIIGDTAWFDVKLGVTVDYGNDGQSNNDHLHFSIEEENDVHPHWGKENNPLDQYYGSDWSLQPFSDTHYPVIHWIKIVEDETTTELSPDSVGGEVDIWVRASDTTSYPGGYDTNNGIYSVSYKIESDLFWTGDIIFDEGIDWWDMDYVYANGSNITTYIYIATNSWMAYNDYWWTDRYDDGYYKLYVKVCDQSDNCVVDSMTVRVWNTTDIEEKEDLSGVPKKFSLSQNYPNPFNPDTKIDFSIPRNSKVRLCIYNVMGQRIKTLVDEYNVQANRIIFANMISCPEGLQALANQYPEVKVVTACVDECLNSEKYIVPGLGDYGDRFYNSS